jgi:hypothetical protein
LDAGGLYSCLSGGTSVYTVPVVEVLEARPALFPTLNSLEVGGYSDDSSNRGGSQGASHASIPDVSRVYCEDSILKCSRRGTLNLFTRILDLCRSKAAECNLGIFSKNMCCSLLDGCRFRSRLQTPVLVTLVLTTVNQHGVKSSLMIERFE